MIQMDVQLAVEAVMVVPVRAPASVQTHAQVAAVYVRELVKECVIIPGSKLLWKRKN